MSSTILGEVRRFPLIVLSLQTPYGSRTLEFLVDTGFDGELALPKSFAAWLGTPGEFRTVLFANGHEERAGVVECALTWGDGILTVDAMFIDSERPLLGIELLENHRLTIDVQEGGEVSIEEL